MSFISGQVGCQPFSRRTQKDGDSSHKLSRAVLKIRCRLSSACRFLSFLGYVLRHETRSLAGRIRILLSTDKCLVHFGPWYEALPPECPLVNIRTVDRVRCTQELEACYPWASTVDRHIFLRGFDAGEEFAHREACNAQRGHDRGNA